MDNGILWLTVIVVLAISTLFFGGLVMLIRMNRPTVTSQTTNVGATATAPATAGANPAPANATTVSTSTAPARWSNRAKTAFWVVGGAILLFLFIIGLPSWLVSVFGFNWATRTAVGGWLAGAFGASWANTIIWAVLGGGAILLFLKLTGSMKLVGGVTSKIPSLSMESLLMAGVAILFIMYVMAPLISGVMQYANTPEPQTVTFARMNNQTVLGQQRTLTVTPLETWRLTLGRVSGGVPEGYRYVVCPTSSLSVLSRLGRNVFIGHQLAPGDYRYQLSPPARLMLVQAGIEKLQVTYSYHLVGVGRTDPCRQETIQ